MLKITRLHIKNFRSFRDYTLELKDLQLFIGPNNSGKTNLLKAFEFLREVTNSASAPRIDLDRIRFQHKESHDLLYNRSQLPDPVEVTVELELKGNASKLFFYYKIELYKIIRDGYFDIHNTTHNEMFGINDKRLNDEEFKNIKLSDYISIINKLKTALICRNNTIPIGQDPIIKNTPRNDPSISYNYQVRIEGNSLTVSNPNFALGQFLNSFSGDAYLDSIKKDIWNTFQQLIIYKPETHYIKQPIGNFTNEKFISGDGSNIVPYLEGLLSSDPETFHKINTELEKCIPDFKGYNFETIDISIDQDTVTKARILRLKDRFEINHRAEDISEGTLYFLMLYAIIAQKNMPSVLMLEEPETNIHPRRIGEIMEYIFKLREQYPDISIIITTHHPYVVDFFKDLTDRVWIFDAENGETKIKNLERDVIDPSNEKLMKKEIEPIDYSSSLGEHWAMGFLGGVPKPVSR